MTAQSNAGVGEAGTTVTRRLVIADMAHQYSVAPVADAPVLVAELAAEAGDGTRAMEFLRPGQTASGALSAVRATGQIQPLAPPAAPLPTWSCTHFPADFTAYLANALAATDGIENSASATLSALGPLLLLRTHTTASGPFTEVLICARYRAHGTLFVRTARFAHAADISLADLVARALEYRTVLQDHMRIESNAYINCEEDIEIEQKVTLLDEASIWSLTKDMWTAVEAGDFPGFITYPGYELTRWHFVQHNFEVTGPAEEVGHYAFQENPGNRYQLKMKKFPADALRRQETFRKGVEVPGGDFEAYLAREFPALSFRRLPSFRRTRFDVNVHSLATGHGFGIETDEVTVDAAGGRKLRQVEMEYLETYRHEGLDATTIDDEMERLTRLVEAHLAKAGVASERNHYSKLSFLRDCVAAGATAPSPTPQP
ncbi:hypothetical protein [Streptomyces silvensis]|uniref:Uncharacterized protein n=1 Tax=Streptomyces silvensis TaxID=1765722 RepID=A0A0W7WZ54_9ACTN|nr:hypothetical protein [Streptomyces silvensis]KUF15855.1 hypothetical protein AT728_14215 [Streptomyces silvensis]